jgi:hypothetical protein
MYISIAPNKIAEEKMHVSIGSYEMNSLTL